MANTAESNQYRPRSPVEVNSHPLSLDSGEARSGTLDNSISKLNIGSKDFSRNNLSEMCEATNDLQGNTNQLRMLAATNECDLPGCTQTRRCVNAKKFEITSSNNIQKSVNTIQILRNENSNLKSNLRKIQFEKEKDNVIIRTLQSKLSRLTNPSDNSEGRMSRCGTDATPELPDCQSGSSMSSSGYPVMHPESNDDFDNCGTPLHAVVSRVSSHSSDDFVDVSRESEELMQEKSQKIESLERQLKECDKKLTECNKKFQASMKQVSDLKAEITEMNNSVSQRERKNREHYDRKDREFKKQFQELSKKLETMAVKCSEFDKLSSENIELKQQLEALATENVELREQLSLTLEQVKEHEEAFRAERADREALNKEKKKYERYYQTYETERDAALFRVQMLERQQHSERSQLEDVDPFSPSVGYWTLPVVEQTSFTRRVVPNETSAPRVMVNEISPVPKSTFEQLIEQSNQAPPHPSLQHSSLTNSRLVLSPRPLPHESSSRFASLTSGPVSVPTPDWTCKYCTYVNTAHRRLCDMCNNLQEVFDIDRPPTNAAHLEPDEVNTKRYVYNDELT